MLNRIWSLVQIAQSYDRENSRPDDGKDLLDCLQISLAYDRWNGKQGVPFQNDVRSGPGILSRGDLTRYSLKTFHIARAKAPRKAAAVKMVMVCVGKATEQKMQE